ncbi:hypothetical protein J6590_020284 [Homalodisca vitripennis]|nr:hypothetical protein J6590_020284 [Homalodisca vitripennis]
MIPPISWFTTSKREFRDRSSERVVEEGGDMKPLHVSGRPFNNDQLTPPSSHQPYRHHPTGCNIQVNSVIE